MDFGSVSQSRALKLCSAVALRLLESGPKDWSRVLLCGPDEPTFRVRFTVPAELQGQVLGYRFAAPFHGGHFCQ